MAVDEGLDLTKRCHNSWREMSGVYNRFAVEKVCNRPMRRMQNRLRTILWTCDHCDRQPGYKPANV